MNEKNNGTSESLHLVGNPIKLMDRSKAMDVVKRNRPRSALYDKNSPDSSEITRRPFSAGTLTGTPAIKSFLRTSHKSDFFKQDSTIEDRLQDSRKFHLPLKSPPMLFEKKKLAAESSPSLRSLTPDSISDLSEDTYVSLGSRIKAKAQVFENLKPFELYNLSSSGFSSGSDNSIVNGKPKYEVEEAANGDNKEDSLAGRVSFGSTNGAIPLYFDNYDVKRYTLGNQLSLVEEESSEGSEHNALSERPNTDEKIQSIQDNVIASICDDYQAPNKFWTNGSLLHTEENDKNEIDSSSSQYFMKENYYPTYLKDNSVKVYTSQVIKDYEREIANIDTLHQLTIEDLKNETQPPAKKEETNFDKLPITNTTNEVIKEYLAVKGDTPNRKSAKNKKCSKKSTKITKPVQKTPDHSSYTTTRKNQKLNAQKIYLHPRCPAYSNGSSIIEIDRDIESWMSTRVTTPVLNLNDNSMLGNSEQSTDSTEDNEKKIENGNEGKQIESKDMFDISRDLEAIELQDRSKDDHIIDLSKDLKVIDLQERLNDDHIKEEVPQKPSAEYCDIVSFLEKVEDSANATINNVTKNNQSVIPKIEALMKLSTAELAHQIVTNSLQIEEKSCCIALLQETLAQSKQKAAAKLRELEKQCRQSVYRAKQDCDEVVKRHQTFIDRLISDKKALNHQIEQMVEERRAVEERWRHSTNALEEKHKVNMKNQNDRLSAAHQLAKQRWVKQKADKIKELTVKGLESELREMADKQQRELAAMRISNAQREAALEDKHMEDTMKLKDSLTREKNEAIDHEKRLSAERMEQQMANIELTYQQQRMRLMAEVRAEGERTISESVERDTQTRREFETWRETEEQRMKEKEEVLRKEIENKSDDLLQDNMRFRESLEVNFEKYKSEFSMEQQRLLKKREMDIQAYYKKERDIEIEKAIESMEHEAQKSRQDMQELVLRTKEQYSLSLKELSETEQATLNRCQEAQARLRTALDTCSSLEIKIAQLEAKIRLLNEENIQLKEEMVKISHESLSKISEEKEKLNFEMDILKKSHNEVMHQLYAKVKTAVARKDTALTTLGREHQRANDRIIHLEQRLEQQRKDYFEAKR